MVVELAPVRSFGRGVTIEEVLATRGEPGNPLPLPPLPELAPYSVATAERRGLRIEVRLWMSERDAAEYLRRREGEGVDGAAIFSVLPSRLRP